VPDLPYPTLQAGDGGGAGGSGVAGTEGGACHRRQAHALELRADTAEALSPSPSLPLSLSDGCRMLTEVKCWQAHAEAAEERATCAEAAAAQASEAKTAMEHQLLKVPPCRTPTFNPQP